MSGIHNYTITLISSFLCIIIQNPETSADKPPVYTFYRRSAVAAADADYAGCVTTNEGIVWPHLFSVPLPQMDNQVTISLKNIKHKVLDQ